MTGDVWLPVADVAHLTGVPERTIREWVRRGRVPSRGDKRNRTVTVEDVINVTRRKPAPRLVKSGRLP